MMTANFLLWMRVNINSGEAMTDQEVKDWVASEYKRSLLMPQGSGAKQIRYRAKIIFDKRFPNPDVCPCCNQKVRKP